MKKILLAVLLGIGMVSFSQTEYSAWPSTGKGVSTAFATDYHCLGINPANLGWKRYDDKSFTMGSSEFGVSVYSESLGKQDLRDNIWAVVVSRELDTLSYDQKISAAEGFASDFSFNWDYNMFGFSYQNEKFGGIGFSVRTSASWNSSFGSQFSDLLFRGKYNNNYFDSLQYWNGNDTVMIANYGNVSPDSSANVLNGVASVPLPISEIMDGTSLRLSLNREFHLGYGRRLLNIKDTVFSLYGGVGFKYIQGIAMMNLSSENGQLTMNSAFSPGFDLDYGAAALTNPSYIASNGYQFFKSPVGNGYGVDFGATASFFNTLHLSAAVTNIGSITYTTNVFTVRDTLLVDYSSAGIKDMNVSNSVGEMLEEGGILELRGQDEYKISLPGTFRLGARFDIGNVARIGAEAVAPFNDVPGSIDGFAWGLGGEVLLWRGQLQLMAGLTGGGGYDFQVPLGINFAFGGGAYEVGVASRDALTFFLNNEPTISMAFGFARARF